MDETMNVLNKIGENNPNVMSMLGSLFSGMTSNPIESDADITQKTITLSRDEIEEFEKFYKHLKNYYFHTLMEPNHGISVQKLQEIVEKGLTDEIYQMVRKEIPYRSFSINQYVNIESIEDYYRSLSEYDKAIFKGKYYNSLGLKEFYESILIDIISKSIFKARNNVLEEVSCCPSILYEMKSSGHEDITEQLNQRFEAEKNSKYFYQGLMSSYDNIKKYKKQLLSRGILSLESSTELDNVWEDISSMLSNITHWVEENGFNKEKYQCVLADFTVTVVVDYGDFDKRFKKSGADKNMNESEG